MKTALLLGSPSLFAFFASAFSQVLENIHFFFFLSAAALLVAIVPHLIGATARR